MPTYEYACTRCDQHIEVVQSMSDAPLAECGACGGRLRKVFSPIGIVFKGSGFYRTDSRSKPGASAGAGSKGSGESKPAASTAPDGTGKSDSKSDSKSGSSAPSASPSPTSKPSEKSA